jgi:hypothetical protein
MFPAGFKKITAGMSNEQQDKVRMEMLDNRMSIYEAVEKHCDHTIRGHSIIKDFSFYELGATERTPNLYCPICQAHWLRGKHWTKAEWQGWINKEEGNET